MDLRIGDLIQCRDNHYNRGLEIVNRIGMVAELRRRDIRVLFDADNQSTWLSKRGVNRVTLPRSDNPGLLDRLTWILHFTRGTECELDLDADGNYRYTVACDGISLTEALELRRYMGSLLAEMRIVPRGMTRIGLELTFLRTAASPEEEMAASSGSGNRVIR